MRAQAELEGDERLEDGRVVHVRPIRPEDAGLEQAFVEGLSPQSRWMRFQGAVSTLTPSMLARLTQVDFSRDMALVAMDRSGGAEREVAVCRYNRLPDGRSCEFAIVVADDWQHDHLGPRLMRRLIALARERGLETMVGWVLASNRPMLHMCADLGFTAEAEPGDAHLRKVSLRLLSP